MPPATTIAPPKVVKTPPPPPIADENTSYSIQFFTNSNLDEIFLKKPA
jgi:hypothetical protein